MDGSVTGHEDIMFLTAFYFFSHIISYVLLYFSLKFSKKSSDYIY